MNAITAPWIHCLTMHGPKKLSPIEVYQQAHDILSIIGSPRDRFSQLRFLLAAGAWVNPICEPQAIAEKLLANKNYFQLDSTEQPFLQNPDAPKKRIKPIGYLLDEYPTGNTVTYIHGVQKTYDEGNYGFCNECCVKGMMRFPAWCLMGGSGINSGLNPASVYAYPVGETLLETFQLNWITPTKDDKPSWVKTTEEKKIGILEGYTFQPRSINLIAGEGGDCFNCGCKTKMLYRSCYFEAGCSRKENTWEDDPHRLQTYTPRNPIDSDDKEIFDFAKFAVNVLLQEKEETTSSHLLNRLTVDKSKWEVVAISNKQAKVFKEYQACVRIEQQDGKIEKIYSDNKKLETIAPAEKEKEKVNCKTFLGKLYRLNAQQLGILRSACGNLFDNLQAMEVFTGIWRNSRLRGKKLPLTVATAFAHYPKRGWYQLAIEDWPEIPGGEAFLERLLREVKFLQEKHRAIDWNNLLTNMYSKVKS